MTGEEGWTTGDGAVEVLERIRRGYRAIGPGAPHEVLAMFHQDEADAPEWVVDDGLRIIPARGVVATDLVAGAIPGHWEVMGVDLRTWDYYERRSRLVVAGRFRTRPRGTWETVPLPFVHIWSLAGDQVQGVLDFLAGIEVKRRSSLRPRRRGWWRGGAA